MSAHDDDLAAAKALLSADAVRVRCQEIFACAKADRLAHFRYQPENMAACVEAVIAETRANYPDLKVPFHARLRHLPFDTLADWPALRALRHAPDRRETLRLAFDLLIISVLLDAGAGDAWSWRDPQDGRRYARSEGLAMAALRLSESGLLSADAERPLAVHGAALQRLTRGQFAEAFQVSDINPLEGLDGRLSVLHALGGVVSAQPHMFGSEARLGNLADRLCAAATASGVIRAPDVLASLLRVFNPIWPGRLQIAGVPLGDVGEHPAVRTAPLPGLLPLHKLSQWLCYSLLEPLAQAGFTLADLDGLTGLAEYRNGGLFLDSGVLCAKYDDVLRGAHLPSAEIVVEWRALTVALLDEVAVQMRAKLRLTPEQLPLAAVLQGGTWTTGRRLARERRSGGAPPLRVVSDGTVF